ncbi:uncharacterized protein LOC124131306 [Haliotis rufescens]|uniref:uncharacterized protein LOC124131306 n=1 Tax=Haliotis rufescens TaxID=6454 RepID=UPI00201F56B1|nr:uncharacterized protein LOC124131306 [Haliotis rufescens]
MLTMAGELLWRTMILVASLRVCLLVSASWNHEIFKVKFNLAMTNTNVTREQLMSCQIKGPQQCKRVCAMTTDCKSFFYNKHSHVCQFHRVVFDTHVKAAGQGWLRYYSRFKDGNKDHVTRLLIGHTSLRQLHLSNYSMDNYNYLRLRRFYALAFVARQRMLVASSPDEIISSRLDVFGYKVLQSRKRCSYISVDEENEILFLAGRISVPGLARMTFEGDSYRLIFPTNSRYGSLQHIASTSKEKVVYANCKRTLLSITYLGDVKQVFTPSSNLVVRGMALDQGAGVLYYSTRSAVFKISLAQNTTSIITQVEIVPNRLLYRDNKMYITNGRLVISLDLNSTQMIHNRNVMGHVSVLCLVP